MMIPRIAVSRTAWTFLSPLALVLAFTSMACGGTPKPESAETPATSSAAAGGASSACHEVHERCEPFEGKGGLAQECHDMSEGPSAKETDCATRRDECWKACAPAK